jgi:hypothetical protein
LECDREYSDSVPSEPETGTEIVALPREVYESNDFSMLPKSLSKASLIDLQGLSAGSPKPVLLKSERQQQVQIADLQHPILAISSNDDPAPKQTTA